MYAAVNGVVQMQEVVALQQLVITLQGDIPFADPALVVNDEPRGRSG